jgi:hypothetical protein
MYVNYFDRVEKPPDENTTIDVLLCANKNHAVVRFFLPEDATAMFLPTTALADAAAQQRAP